jgi:hypothetical protein
VGDLVNRWWSLLPGFDATQHLTGPFVVEANGSHASARCAVTGTHRLGEAAWTVGGHYQMSLSRQDDRWVIEAITLETAFVDGDTGLPERAQERAASGAGRASAGSSNG